MTPGLALFEVISCMDIMRIGAADKSRWRAVLVGHVMVVVDAPQRGDLVGRCDGHNALGVSVFIDKSVVNGERNTVKVITRRHCLTDIDHNFVEMRELQLCIAVITMDINNEANVIAKGGGIYQEYIVDHDVPGLVFGCIICCPGDNITRFSCSSRVSGNFGDRCAPWRQRRVAGSIQKR